METEFNTGDLKIILSQLRDPASLGGHPWINTRFYKQYQKDHPELKLQAPGSLLALAVADLFRISIPGSPPRRKKRIDTRWGEFGILAANYFAPFLFGKPYPRSLSDSCEQIDAAILQFISMDGSEPGAGQKEEYALVGGESTPIPNSTLSDWHTNGLQRFTQFIVEREQNLALLESQVAKSEQTAAKHKNYISWKYIFICLSIILIVVITFAGLKVWRVYSLAQQLIGELRSVQQQAPTKIDDIPNLSAEFIGIKQNLHAIDIEIRPYLWLTPYFKWVPTYGQEIENSGPLLDFALALTDTIDPLLPVAEKLVETLSGQSEVGVETLTATMIELAPNFEKALLAIDKAEKFRQQIDTANLPAQLQQVFIKQYDPNIQTVRLSLLAASNLPELLGASDSGSKTYLIILQNEDELRPTGGFLTSIGQINIADGSVDIFPFEDSYAVDDESMTYPAAPWQLTKYMNSDILMLRDANWFPSFPKAVEWVKYLYAYTHDPSIDGVIAVDQYALQQILKATGPVNVPGLGDPVGAGNVIAYMRKAKSPPAGITKEEWDRKAFINDLANPLIDKIFSGQNVNWTLLVQTITNLLDQKHILLQFNNSAISDLISTRAWDGLVSTGSRGADYLMVIDSNIGFTKTTAVVSEKMKYSVDLRDLLKPVGQLEIEHSNNSPVQTACDWAKRFDPATNLMRVGESGYVISACYIDYLRIFTPAGTQIKSASPHAIPAEWTIDGTAVPARIDLLDEGIQGVQAFGTLLIVPTGESMKTTFEFSLPSSIVLKHDQSYLYSIKIQKQPGTIANPFFLKIILPANASNIKVPPGTAIIGNEITLELTLQKDRNVEIYFDINPQPAAP